MKNLEKLTITIENQNDFKTLKECGNVYVMENAKFDAPVLATCGYVNVMENAKFDAPVLATCGNVDVMENAKFDAPVLATCGNVDVMENAKFDAPVLATCGYVYVMENAKFDAPVLATCGNVNVMENAKFDAPVLATCGYVYVMENAKFDAPVLATCGNVYVMENAKFVTKLTKKLKYKSVDTKMFVIESEKSTKGIKIYSGYNFKGLKNKVIQKEQCFVAEKEGFLAHGITAKQAIQDCLFKAIAEKIKKAPINKDTVIDANYYHTVTGSCVMGINSFIKQHELKESYKAGELLPILESKRAYGFEKFKQLITFQ